MIQCSPSRFAVVRVPPASEPASGSVRDQAPIFSPRASGTRYFSFCASVPNLKMWFEQSELCAAIMMPTEPSTRESSSMAITYSIDRHEILFFLCFGAKFEDVVRAERVVRGDNDADRAVHAREFFDGNHVFDVAEASAAVFFRENDAEQAHFGKLGNDFDGKARGFVPHHDMRGDFAFGEFADAAAELLLFVGELEVHGNPSGQRAKS